VAPVHDHPRRALARNAGLTGQTLAAQVRVSYAKVAEYQRRGVVHFHAIIRLDGPAGPTTSPPDWATLALLTAAIDQAARAVSVTTPAAPGLPAAPWHGARQLDIRPVTATGEEPRCQRWVALGRVRIVTDHPWRRIPAAGSGATVIGVYCYRSRRVENLGP
jgi:hypothetical protein